MAVAVSIIVPVYNVAPYLRECLDSLVNQTLPDLEFICVNDGSTDSSCQILQEYSVKDKRIKIINKQNSGYGHSMNVGIEHSKGEYIGIIEADDFCEPDMFETLYSLTQNDSIDIVKSDWYVYWSKNNKNIKAGQIARFPGNRVINANTHIELMTIQPSIWSAIYRRDFLLENDIHFLETPGASYQDVSFYLKSLIMAKSIKIHHKAFVHYRQDNPTSSCNSKDKVYCICDEYNEMEKYIMQHPETIKPFMEFIYTLQYDAYLWNLKRINEIYVKDFIKRYQKDFKRIYENGYCKNSFFKRIHKKEFMLLLENTDKFYELCKKQKRKEKFKKFRQNLISIKISPSRISVVLFGKQIVDIG